MEINRSRVSQGLLDAYFTTLLLDNLAPFLVLAARQRLFARLASDMKLDIGDFLPSVACSDGHVVGHERISLICQ
jgi:hypothetical protein